MTSGQPLPLQLWAIACAAVCGAACGALYDFFRVLRWSFDRRWLELLLDAVFSLAVIVALFVLVTGVTQLRLRGFLPLAMLAGGLLWSCTLGTLFRPLLKGCGQLLVQLIVLPRRLSGLAAHHVQFYRKKEESDSPNCRKSQKNKK